MTNDDERLAAEDERRWIVLLEATPKAEASFIDKECAREALRAMGDEDAVGLHCPDRVALQVGVPAGDAAMALSRVLRRWRAAASQPALHGWEVVRAEVLTPEEFEHDCAVG